MGGLLHAAGIPMGSKLLMKNTIPAHLRPRYDYYEDKDIVTLQDMTLKLLQRHWSSYKGSYPLNDEDTIIKKEFREQLSVFIRQRLKMNNLWAVKDPRISILLEEWIKALTVLNIQIKVIIVHRDPLININSFSDKGRVPRKWAEALWQRTYMNVLTNIPLISSENVIFKSFEEIINEPEKSTIDICDFLGHPINSDLKERINSHVDKELPSKELNNRKYCLMNETNEINEMLIKKKWNTLRINKENLLSKLFESTLAEFKEGLGLNSLYRNGNLLLKKAKVAILTSEFQGIGLSGGIGSAYYELANSLVEAGHEVYIILVNDMQEEIYEAKAIKIININPRILSRLELLREIKRTVKDINPEVIHTHEWQGFGSGLNQPFEESNAKLIIGLHGPSAWTRTGNPWAKEANGSLKISEKHLYEEGLIRALEEDAILNADILISPSYYMKNWVQENMRIKKDVIVQRNCALSKRFIKNRDYKAINVKKIIYFGRLEERKGLYLFLEALGKITSQPEEIIFLGSDCFLKEEILASDLIKQRLEKFEFHYEINSNFNRHEALNLIKEKDYIVIIPSIIENSPCVVEELLDTNIRVIATDTGGIKEMIIDSDIQWLAQTNSTDLAKKIDLALKTEDLEAFILRSKIREWEIKLSWQAFHERLSMESITNKDELKVQKSIYKVSLKNIKRKIKYILSTLFFKEGER